MRRLSNQDTGPDPIVAPGATINLTRLPPDLEIHTGQDLLRIACNTLPANAVNYSRQHGKIEV
jgi:hypothetical protein